MFHIDCKQKPLIKKKKKQKGFQIKKKKDHSRKQQEEILFSVKHCDAEKTCDKIREKFL